MVTRKCYVTMLEIEDHLQTMCVEEQQTMAKLVEKLEEVPLDNSKPERTTMIGTLANPPVY